MKNYDVVIIGAGPAGIVTGATIKKQYPHKSVIVFAEEEKGLVPCGIPYIFHHLNSVEKNVMMPKAVIDAGGEVVVDYVTNVDADVKTVTTESGGIYKFEKLIFATGSRAVVANFIPGYDLENVFYVRKSYNYITKMFAELKEKKNIVVVGGGFIGAEIAEQLSLNLDKKVKLIESEEYCFSKAFSNNLSKIATEQLRKTDVDVFTSSMVQEILGEDGKVKAVRLKDGNEFEADAIILAVGYKPNTQLAIDAGLTVNRNNAIVVDNYKQSSVKDIYAVGDCSQTLGFLTGRDDFIMLASTATAEARILGYNLFGLKIKNRFSGTIGIFSTVIKDLSMAAAGLNEKNGLMTDVDYIEAEFSAVDRHPGTIDDTSSLSVKLFVSPTDGSILGGEVWGGKSAGEIINTIGLAIQKNVTIYELISYQIGSHPLLTTAPTMPVFIKAAEVALNKIEAQRKIG